MPEISFRPCRPDDVEQALPLIYSSGPLAFDYVFCDTDASQSLAFLRAAFMQKGTEFSHQQHTVAILDGQVVGIGAVRWAQQNTGFTLAAAKAIFAFYGLAGGLRVIIRGLKIELIDQLIAQIRARGLGIAGLDVAQTNPRAQALYTALGFVPRAVNSSTLTSRFASVCDHTYMERVLPD